MANAALWKTVHDRLIAQYGHERVGHKATLIGDDGRRVRIPFAVLTDGGIAALVELGSPTPARREQLEGIAHRLGARLHIVTESDIAQSKVTT
jgi:hypothetical protein